MFRLGLHAIILKFLKFGIVGLTGLIVDFGITYLLKEKLNIQKFIANATGFAFAATSNYLLNRTWTFQSNNPNILLEFLHFFIVAILGLAINSLILWVLTTKKQLNFYFAKFLAIIVATLWNFIANLIFTFV